MPFKDIMSEINIGSDFKAFKFKSLNLHSDTVSHCLSSRLGGVSSDNFNSLNLGLQTIDEFSNIIKNYKIISDKMGFKLENIVFSRQVHGDNIRIINNNIINSNNEDYNFLKMHDKIPHADAMITNLRNVVLTVYFADCVPVFFYDFNKKIIAVAHSGWKGTVLDISRKVVSKFISEFNSNIEDIKVAIGPSIGECCYEVGQDVYNKFIIEFPNYNFGTAVNNKMKINLAEIISNSLIEFGVKSENISNSDICTSCSNNYFFSHRADNNNTGRNAGFIWMN